MIDKTLQLIPQDHPWRSQIRYFDIITSTNDVLKQMAQQGAPHGTVLFADRQTGGRGRLGRTFLSPAGVGIYLSVLLRPSCRPDELMHLTCAAACAACDAIEAAVGFRPSIKWTNDIVYQKKKLSGILTEMSLTQTGQVDYAVIGIGINCCQKETDFSEEIRSFAGSLQMFSENPIERERVAAEMILAFSKMDATLLSCKEQWMQQYRENCITIGQDVVVSKLSEKRTGKALDVTDDGALLVRYESGEIACINTGEVSVRGLYSYV